ncbi:helicase-related protein [Pyramidobacter piscolens]|uniref:helicase-related protein n=1 Tax=Pyramidobacter piscolens TaxID=638849 RepID=UPI0028E35052|nr:helicase-related protein [Pyramidobacter piscolens]
MSGLWKGAMTSMANTTGFASRDWELEYRTSHCDPDAPATDMVRDFYEPALSMARQYDRVAGFFTSSSLAAAARGFSEFVAHEGKARFIVGSDLDPKDADAVIHGEEVKASEILLRKLGDFDDLPLGQALCLYRLTWLVAKGHLEIRIAFCVDAKGCAEKRASSHVGYFHEKWGLFRDAEGHEMMMSGSLNESKTALAENAENIEVFRGWINEENARRIRFKREDFERMWADQARGLRVLKLPEAVRRGLIDLCEPLRKRCLLLAAKNPNMERLRFNIIKDAPLMPNGQYVGLETAAVEPWPHQRETARTLIDRWPMGAMICDEVGLGKTIEAGLAIRSLLLSRRVRKVLILAPAGLCRQWQNEMASKFNLPFACVKATSGGGYEKSYIYPSEKVVSGAKLFSENLSIFSTGLFRMEKHFDALMAEERPDLVLVDEAHYARRHSPDRDRPDYQNGSFGRLYRHLADLAKRMEYRRMWLATATPMQLNWIESWDLMKLMRASGWYDNDPTLMKNYYDALNNFADGNFCPWQGQLLGSAKRQLERTDPRFDSLRKVREKETERLIQGETSISSFAKKELGRIFFRTAPLSQVMIRHTRELLKEYKKHGLLAAGLAEREIMPSPSLRMSREAESVSKALREYCCELPQHMGDNLSESKKANIGFYQNFLRVRFASSTYALEQTLQRRSEKIRAVLDKKGGSVVSPDEDITGSLWEEQDDRDSDLDEQLHDWFLDRSERDLRWELAQLEALLQAVKKERECWNQALPGKLRRVLAILDERRQDGGRFKQFVLFSRFFDTVKAIRDQLVSRVPNLRWGVYSGSECSWFNGCERCGASRDEIRRLFCSGAIDVLLCTDAAAEGLNLQTSDLLVNYDLPWNPMKLEQRIGRIDRIGQKYDHVTVQNLYYEGSVEEAIYVKLTQRLAETISIVGTQRPSILPITQEDFQRLASGEVSIEELEKDAIAEFERMRQMRSSLEPDAADLMKQYKEHKELWEQQPAPVSVSQIWRFLKSSHAVQDSNWQLSDEDTLRKDVFGAANALTDSKERYDLGMEGVQVGFCSYGNPDFDALVKEGGLGELAPWCCRFRAEGEGLELVAYGVAAADGPRLISSLGDLENVQINFGAELSEQECEGLQLQVEKLLKAETAKRRIFLDALDKAHEAGRAQNNLNLSVANSLLETYCNFGGNGTSPDDSVEKLLEWLDKKNAFVDGYRLCSLKGCQPSQFSGASFTSASTQKDFIAPAYVIDSAVAKIMRLRSSSKRRKDSGTLRNLKDSLYSEIIRLSK